MNKDFHNQSPRCRSAVAGKAANPCRRVCPCSSPRRLSYHHQRTPDPPAEVGRVCGWPQTAAGLCCCCSCWMHCDGFVARAGLHVTRRWIPDCVYTNVCAGWLKMQDMKMTDHQNCKTWNCSTKQCRRCYIGANPASANGKTVCGAAVWLRLRNLSHS